MTQAEKFPDPFLLKSDVNLFNHLVRKADVAGCCSGGFCFVDMRLPRIQCFDLYCLKLFLRYIDADHHHDTRAFIIDYLTWFDGLHARCDM